MKTWKLVLLVLALVGLPAVVQAQFTFTTNNGAITITGYIGPGGTVIIPSMTNGYPVTSIGYSAFLNCTGVTDVTIPNGVTSIQSSAFLGCSALTNVVIPGSVTNIAFQAFTDCGLTSVVIPGSVMSIGQSAFMYCHSLTSVTIGNGVIGMGDGAFYGCSSLTNVFIPQSVTNITGTAFNECYAMTNITVDAQNPAYSSLAGVLFDKNQTKLVDYPDGMTGTYTVPSSVTSIGDFACALSTNLTSITIPNSVTNIGTYAFYGCTWTNIMLPTNLITIGAYAFSGCNLTAILLPNSVTTIGQGAFSGTFTNILIPNSVTNIGPEAFGSSRLNAITVATNNPAYSSVGGVLFDISQTTLVEFPIGKSGSYFKPGSYIIPNGVISIRDAAFEGCYLTNLTIPDSVTSIGNSVFAECYFLANLTIPNNVTNIGNEAFADTRLTSIIIPASVITFGSFGFCPNLRSVYFDGNAPGPEPGIPSISEVQNVTAYYLPGTTGWGTYFQDIVPTALWLPAMQTSTASLGGQTNQFGFNITWASGQTVVVEACTNLSNPVWQPVQTNTLTSSAAYFSDPQWTNYSGRFYRLRSP